MDIVPGRMGLLLTLLLCMVNIFNSADTKYPKTAKAIILWILSCILFIILPILEYALLLGYKKYKKTAKVHSRGSAIASENDQIETFSKQLDKWMLVIFPPTFLLFTTLFWSHFDQEL